MSIAAQQDYKLADQEARNRFANEIENNFSVIAPAGVGKTTAIVQRILNIATSWDYNILPSRLSKLVVVTYTQKAADEMRHRSYQALLRANVSPLCLQEFNKAFFGTIHSFCLKIIQTYGPQIGITNSPTLLIDDSDLWYEFLNNNDSFLNLIPEGIREGLFKHLNLEKLSQLARRINPGQKISLSPASYPKLDCSPILNYIPKKSSKKILELQKQLQLWWTEYQENPVALEIPEINQGDSDFKELCAKVFSSLWHWLGDASFIFVMKLAQKYQQFRVEKGRINYDDMVELAAKLLMDPYVISIVCSLDYHVILDEAQDTDNQQFEVLLKIGQHFCMLGDPQQAIYSSRADLPTYLKIHNDLLSSQTLQALTFNVTMRCDEEIVNHCNGLFPSILKDKSLTSQANFVPLTPRPWAEKGFVGKINIDPAPHTPSKLNISDLEKYEATLLAQKIHQIGLLGLGITDWSEIAILTPRKSWLTPIAKAFQSLGIPAQIHSSDDVKGNDPAFAWMTALCAVISSPNDSFELTGILRDIFGISDDEIANFVQYWASDKNKLHPLNISQIQDFPQNSFIAQTLNLLLSIRNESLLLSLSECVRNIVEKIGLKSRLASLPDYDTKKLLDSLDALLIQATLSEEQGLSLAEFTTNLKKLYDTPADCESEIKGHIQCYTSHKAKGLEWPVVIVPFLFRSILFPPQEYPQLISVGSEHPSKIAVSDHPDKKEFSALLEQFRIAELERLLYVTATRARNTLLWVDDETLFPDSKNSFATFLKVNSMNLNRQAWDNIASPLPQKTNENIQASLDIPSISSQVEMPSFEPTILSKARSLSRDFLRSIVPSKLNSKSESPIIKKASKDYSPIEYGIWWHKMMETLPWHSQKTQRIAHLHQFISSCPEGSRGEIEIDLFLNSHLFEQLLEYPYNIQTEIPFLFRDDQNSCYDGVIDFFAYAKETGESLIIDWKTDLFDTEVDISQILRDKYSAQLSIYKQALNKVSGLNPKTFIFSTPLSKMIGI